MDRCINVKASFLVVVMRDTIFAGVVVEWSERFLAIHTYAYEKGRELRLWLCFGKWCFMLPKCSKEFLEMDFRQWSAVIFLPWCCNYFFPSAMLVLTELVKNLLLRWRLRCGEFISSGELEWWEKRNTIDVNGFRCVQRMECIAAAWWLVSYDGKLGWRKIEI